MLFVFSINSAFSVFGGGLVTETRFLRAQVPNAHYPQAEERYQIKVQKYATGDALARAVELGQATEARRGAERSVLECYSFVARECLLKSSFFLNSGVRPIPSDSTL